MARLTIIAAILSLITYYQNLGVLLSVRPIESTPSRFDAVLSFFYRTFSAITNLITSMPEYDLRLQLNFMVVVIPLLLDIGFLLVLCPKIKIYLHFLDAGACCALFYGLSIVIFGGNANAQTTIIICCVSGGFLFIHLMFYFASLARSPSKSRWTLKTLARAVCNCLIGSILTDQPGEHSIEEISDALASFSDLVQILPSQPSAAATFGFFVLSIALLFVGVWASAGLSFGAVSIPPVLSSWLPFVSLPIGLILLIIAILRLTARGRTIVTRAKQLMRRYGLRVALLLLQALYIPVISLMVDLLLPARFTCGEDRYMRYSYDVPRDLAPFVTRRFECAACAANASGACAALCHAAGGAPWRIQFDPGLLYIEDSLEAVGIVIAYAFLAIVVGIPLLFWRIIAGNQTIVSELLVWGRDAQDKWDNLLARVSSSGVALFADFEYAHAKWTILKLMTSLGVMLVSVLKDRLTIDLLYAFPACYFVVFVLTWKNAPYRTPMNDVLEIWLFALLTGFATIPIFELNGIAIAGGVETGLMIGFVVLPFGAFLSAFCLKDVHRISDEDPTLLKPDQVKEKKREEWLVIKQGRAKKKEEEEEQIHVSYGAIQSVKEQFQQEIRGKRLRIQDGISPADVEYAVAPIVLAKQMTRMYKIVDLVLDGATTELLMKVLSAAVVASFLGFGFYIGFVTNTTLPESIVC